MTNVLRRVLAWARGHDGEGMVDTVLFFAIVAAVTLAVIALACQRGSTV